MKHGGGAFHDIAAESLPLPELHALQASKFATLLKTIQNNPFHAARLKNAGVDLRACAPKDLARLPLLTKQELAEDQLRHPPYGTNLSFPLGDYTRFHQTSGSTGGAPLRWLDTPDSWEWMLRSWSSIYHSAGVKAGERIFYAFSFGPFLGFWSAFDAATRYGALCYPGGGLSTPLRLRMLLDNGISIVCCTPTYALRMAEAAVEERINLALSPVRLIIVAGEPGGSIPQTRARIEESWGARCIDHYGMTESGPVSFLCEKIPGRMHVIESEFIAECIDPLTLKPAADGESGELVLTNLGRLGSPLLRYRTGDIVKLTRQSPCACGRSFVSLEGGILGRADDMLIVRGVNVYPSAVEEIVRRVPEIFEYRVEVARVRAMNEMKVIIETADDGTTGPLAAKQLAAELQRTLGLRVPIEIASAGTLPRFEMKAKRWIITN